MAIIHKSVHIYISSLINSVDAIFVPILSLDVCHINFQFHIIRLYIVRFTYLLAHIFRNSYLIKMANIQEVNAQSDYLKRVPLRLCAFHMRLHANVIVFHRQYQTLLFYMSIVAYRRHSNGEIIIIIIAQPINLNVFCCIVLYIIRCLYRHFSQYSTQFNFKHTYAEIDAKHRRQKKNVRKTHGATITFIIYTNASRAYLYLYMYMNIIVNDIVAEDVRVHNNNNNNNP